MKKMMMLVFVFLAATILAACGSTSKNIYNINVHNDTLTFSQVSGATSYEIEVNGVLYHATENSLTLTASAAYAIRLRPILANQETEFSKYYYFGVHEIIYEVGLGSSANILLTPFDFDVHEIIDLDDETILLHDENQVFLKGTFINGLREALHVIVIKSSVGIIEVSLTVKNLVPHALESNLIYIDGTDLIIEVETLDGSIMDVAGLDTSHYQINNQQVIIDHAFLTDAFLNQEQLTYLIVVKLGLTEYYIEVNIQK